MKVLELLSKNWEFVNGRQNTCRLTDKWARIINIGEDIRFRCVEDKERSLVTTVQRVVLARFCDLTDEEIDQNHAYGGREELEAAMVRAYGIAFDPEATVTLIVFDVEGLAEVATAA